MTDYKKLCHELTDKVERLVIEVAENARNYELAIEDVERLEKKLDEAIEQICDDCKERFLHEEGSMLCDECQWYRKD